MPRASSRLEPLNLVGTARRAVRAAFSGAILPAAVTRAGSSRRDDPTHVRFMGRDGVRRPMCTLDSAASWEEHRIPFSHTDALELANATTTRAGSS